MANADAQAVLLICSSLGLPPNSGLTPLTLRDWNPLARKIAASTRQRPGGLLGLTAAEMAQDLDAPPELAERLARLMDRGGSLAIHLARLESLGLWALTRADSAYPQRLRQRLREAAPTVLFGAGELEMLDRQGLAVVGSRNVDEAGSALAAQLGEFAAGQSWTLVSGGARGVDTISAVAALENGGCAVGALAESLERAVRPAGTRTALAEGRLALITPYHPSAPFSVGTAMGRNKLIYALGDFAVVVASDLNSGGTWNGAVEALKAQWVPVFVRRHPDAPAGNAALIGKGAIPLPDPLPVAHNELPEWLAQQAQLAPRDPEQQSLF